MAWPRREDPQPDPEIESFKTKIADLETKFASAVPKEELDAIKSQNEELKQSIGGLQTQLARLNRFAPREETDPVDPQMDMISDPAGFVQRQTMNDRIMSFQTRADLNEIKARQKYPQIFKENEQDLIDSAQKMNLETRAGQNFWDMHIERIMGGKLLKGEIKVGSYPSLMGAGSNTAVESGEAELGLENFEVEYAKKRGIPLEQASKIKKLVKSGEKISLENARA